MIWIHYLSTAMSIRFMLKENLLYLKKTSALENYYLEIKSDNDSQL